MRKFLLIAEPRSGTTFFNSVLRRHPGCVLTGEILPGIKGDNMFHRFWLKQIGKDASAILLNRIKPIFNDFLADRERAAAGASCFGVDIKYYQAEWKMDLLEVLVKRGDRAVHMVRRNLLRRHVSWTLHKPAVREKLQRPLHTTTPQPPARLALENGPELVRVLERMQANVDRWRSILSANFPMLEVVYEDILDQEANSLTRESLDTLYDYLGIEDRRYDLASSLTKINPTLLRHSLANYHDVVETLLGTPFEPLLDDPATDAERLEAYRALAGAEAALGAGRHEEAMAGYMRARAQTPDLPEAVFGLGLTALAMGLQDKGVAHIGQAMQAASGDTAVFFRSVLGTVDGDTGLGRKLDPFMNDTAPRAPQPPTAKD